MNTSFAFKNSRYPIEHFIKVTLLNNEDSLKKYIDSNLIVIDSDCIIFSKTNTASNFKVPKQKHFYFFFYLFKKIFLFKRKQGKGWTLSTKN